MKYETTVAHDRSTIWHAIMLVAIFTGATHGTSGYNSRRNTRVASYFALILHDLSCALFQCCSHREIGIRDIDLPLTDRLGEFREMINLLFVPSKKGRLKKQHVEDNVFMYSVGS